ncbi:MAG: cation diffusion facilitator family transporter [Gemmatimonadota bacterium]
MDSTHHRGIRLAQLGLFTNFVLALVKLITGIVGHSYALIADAVESTVDIFGSAVVWGGLRIAARNPDDRYPYGYGKAESVAAAVVGFLLLGAATGIAIEAVREIVTPHHAPAPFTLIVLGAVILTKELLFRRVFEAGAQAGSRAVTADAWHHRSDAISSAAAFVGITIALIGGRGWESADDWAALVSSLVIVTNGVSLLRQSARDLMDRAPDRDVLATVAEAARSVEGVRAIEKLMARRAGTGYYIDLHVQADPTLSLHDAHVLSGKVKTAIRSRLEQARGVLIHMEPHE